MVWYMEDYPKNKYTTTLVTVLTTTWLSIECSILFCQQGGLREGLSKFFFPLIEILSSTSALFYSICMHVRGEKPKQP